MTLQPLIFCILDRYEKSELAYLRKKSNSPLLLQGLRTLDM